MKQHSSVTKEDQAEAQSLCAKAGKALFGRKDESAALALLDSHQEIRNKPVDWLRTPKSAESFDSNFSLSGSEIGAYPASNEKTCGKQALLSSYLIAMEGA